jgi:DNA invertase Pin-like site-specific DNA recombinase
VQFAADNGLTYLIYEDAGKSGYKISDDDLDPFNNRPAFMELITDIKEGKIDKVWVWEHSRLSRNHYASAFIFNIFEKHEITLYENKKQFDLNDPQIKFTRQILDAVSEYERHLIVNRMTRGLHKRINEGGRVFCALFGYRKDGKDNTGHTKWAAVESEIEIYKFCLNNFMNGIGLRKICTELFYSHKTEIKTLNGFVAAIRNTLRRYQYTGYQLTIEGHGIYKKFLKNETDSVQCLLDRGYWVKSLNYPVELISIENWVRVVEKLQETPRKMVATRRKRILRAGSEIGTGLIECGCCGMKFYYRATTSKPSSAGERRLYYYYYHYAAYNGNSCKQKPKVLYSLETNEIFKIFYFYYSLVFDDERNLLFDGQERIRHKIITLKEKKQKLEKELFQAERNTVKFQSVLDETEDVEIIKVIAKSISLNESQKFNVREELEKTNYELDKQNEKLKRSKKELDFYDVKEKIQNWFYKMGAEEQRNELVKLITKCVIFSYYLLIEAGQTVFLFDTKADYFFDLALLEDMDKDKIYKSRIKEMSVYGQTGGNENYKIFKIDLRNEKIRAIVTRFFNRQFGIIHNLDKISNLISFVDLAGVNEAVRG